MNLTRFSLVVSFVLLLAVAATTQAQILDGPRPQRGGGTLSAPTGNYYDFTGGSGVALQVSIWGFVGSPGKYSVPFETDLLALLSYCGGPREGAYLDRIKIVRRGNVEKQNEIREVIEVNVEKYLRLTSKPAMLSELLLFPGDLIIVDGEDINYIDTFLRVAQVIVAVSSLVTTTVAVINLTKQ